MDIDDDEEESFGPKSIWDMFYKSITKRIPRTFYGMISD